MRHAVVNHPHGDSNVTNEHAALSKICTFSLMLHWTVYNLVPHLESKNDLIYLSICLHFLIRLDCKLHLNKCCVSCVWLRCWFVDWLVDRLSYRLIELNQQNISGYAESFTLIWHRSDVFWAVWIRRSDLFQSDSRSLSCVVLDMLIHGHEIERKLDQNASSGFSCLCTHAEHGHHQPTPVRRQSPTTRHPQEENVTRT